MSVMVGMVTAEVTNGDGTTGINRNATNSEQDGASIDRTYTSLTGLTTDKIDINNGMMMTSAGDITTGSNSYAMSTSTWVDGGLTDIGPVHYLADGAGLCSAGQRGLHLECLLEQPQPTLVCPALLAVRLETVLATWMLTELTGRNGEVA